MEQHSIVNIIGNIMKKQPLFLWQDSLEKGRKVIIPVMRTGVLI